MKIGILALQGDVAEHMLATTKAAKELGIGCTIVEVRIKNDLQGLDGIIIPGGESTTIHMLCERAGIFGDLKRVKNIFGTCAGAIMLAKNVIGVIENQKTLSLMDISVERNAYGPQPESFEDGIDTKLGRINGIFIRAPKIISMNGNVKALAMNHVNPFAVSQKSGDRFYLATTFHPELTTTEFHKLFLTECKNSRKFNY